MYIFLVEFSLRTLKYRIREFIYQKHFIHVLSSMSQALLQTNKRGGAAGEGRLKKKYPTVLIDRPRELSHMAASTHGY